MDAPRPSCLERPPPSLPGDTLVFSHTKLRSSRQSSVVAGMGSPVAESAPPVSCTPPPKRQKLRVESERLQTRRLTIQVLKQGDRLGFGVRHDRHKRLKVSTLQGTVSDLSVGDTLLSVNGVDLTGLDFLTVIAHLKATKPGTLVFQVEREGEKAPELSKQVDAGPGTVRSQPIAAPVAISAVAASVSLSQLPWSAASFATTAAMPPSPVGWNQHCGAQGKPTILERCSAGLPAMAQQGLIPMAALPTKPDAAIIGGQSQPMKKPRRPVQRAVTMLDESGQPVNVTALMADLKKERAEKAALEEKNAGLRKRLQRMLIENDEVRVRASNDVAAAQEKAKREVAEAQNALIAARAQLRLQDRGPDVTRTDSIVNELVVCKAQLERLKAADAERNGLLNARYRGECRIAGVDAQRVLDSFVEMFRSKLRQVGRANRDGASIEVGCDGVRRLAFMKLFRLAHDFAFYTSAAFHAQEPVRHSVEQEQFFDLFGNSLCHEERAGLFYVAIAPMHVMFDPCTECVTLKCQWAEKNALRDLARNFRF